MKLDKYKCDNQISIFDILPSPKKDEPPILLSVGQPVYLVVRGDIEKYYVQDGNPWVCGEKNLGYRLQKESGGGWCTYNTEIGVSAFTSKEEATEKAEKYFTAHECIRKEQIKPVEVKAFTYVRNVDERQMTSFYAILDNGMVYIKEFMTYHYIRKDVDKAIKEFIKQQEFNYDKAEEIDLMPSFKNMYPCKNNSGWIYAEARYNSY